MTSANASWPHFLSSQVQQLKASLKHSRPLEPPLPALSLPEPWPKGFLVEQYLASDLAISTKAVRCAPAYWILEKRPLALEERLLESRSDGKEMAKTIDRGTNTDSIVVDRGGLALASSGNGTDNGTGTESGGVVGGASASKEVAAAVPDGASDTSRQLETLRSHLAETERELEAVRGSYADRVSSLEADLLAGRQALESVHLRNRELEAEAEGQAARVQALTAEMVQARKAWTRQASESDAVNLAEVAGLQRQLETVHDQLTSAARGLTSERLRSEGWAKSAASASLQLSYLSGRVRAWQEERIEGAVSSVKRAARPVNGESCAMPAKSSEALVFEELFRLSGHLRALADEAGANVTRPSARVQSVLEGPRQRTLLRQKSVSPRKNVSSGDPGGACCEDRSEQQEEGELVRELGPDAVVTSLNGELAARERDVARLQKENRRLFRLVEQKEEEAEELQKKLDKSGQGAVALPAETTGGADVGQDEPLTTSSSGDVSPQCGDVIAYVSGKSALQEELESSRAEVVPLRECLEVCEREREAAEQELKRMFADELRTAAEKYESARADFEERVRRVEAEAGTRLEELRGELQRERGEKEKSVKECDGMKEQMKERERDLAAVGGQYRDAAQRAEELCETAAAAKASRREMCAELERAVERMRDQQEVLEVLQRRVQAADTSRASERAATEERMAEEGTPETEWEGGDSGAGIAPDGEGVEKRVAALDGVIEMWRTACRQKVRDLQC